MSNPALKVTRIALHRVATPVPKTRSRVETLWLALADTDARIGCALRMLTADAMIIDRLDRCAFLARGHALLQDLETAMTLVTALQPLDPSKAPWLVERGAALTDQRRRVEMLLRRASP